MHPNMHMLTLHTKQKCFVLSGTYYLAGSYSTLLTISNSMFKHSFESVQDIKTSNIGQVHLYEVIFMANGKLHSGHNTSLANIS